MIRFVTLLLLVYLTLSSAGCDLTGAFGNYCEEYVNQEWAFGDFTAELQPSGATFRKGEPFTLSFRIPVEVIDTNGLPLTIDEGVDIFHKLTDAPAPSARDSSFFGIDTTIFNVFDQYFQQTVVTGVPENVYQFEMERVGTEWVLDVEYIPLRAGNYQSSIQISRIGASEVNDLPPNTCRLASSNLGARAVWQPNNLNTIDPRDTLFTDYWRPTYFNFTIVE